MTQEYTPEPWACPIDDEGNSAVVAKDGYLVTFAFPNGDAADKANGRRIVACVNALAGIPTEAIEGGVIAELVEAAAFAKATLGDIPSPTANEVRSYNHLSAVLAKLEASK